MVEASDFFKFSNPLFLDAVVSIVLYIVSRLLAKRFPRIAEGVREASLVFLVFMAYDTSRYFALDSEALAISNGQKVIDFEKEIHIDIEMSLQAFVVAHTDFSNFLNHFYLGAHWGGLVIFFVWAFARVIFASPNKMERRRKEYVTFRGRFILMNMIASCSFMAYPCAPPRKFPGFVDTILAGGTDVYTGTRGFVNPYAAMPSMHQGYSLLFAITIVIMLRSEILALATGVEPDEEDDVESGKLNDPTHGLRAFLNQLRSRYEQYHVVSPATRSNTRKLFYISLLPLAFLLYPAFMFVVIIGTGNHFVLDSLAGAAAMGLAVLLYPPTLRTVVWIRQNALKLYNMALNRALECVGVKVDIELGEVKEQKESEEKKGFLATETA